MPGKRRRRADRKSRGALLRTFICKLPTGKGACVPFDSMQQIVCCLGRSAAGNPTQFMMERAFSAAGLDCRCLTVEVAADDLPAAVAGMRAMGFHGAAIASPYQAVVPPLLDRATPSAEATGSVSVVVRERGELVGDDVTGRGFVEALSERTAPTGKRFVVLGAGYAARSVAVAAARGGAAQIIVVNRTPDRGEATARWVQEKTGVPSLFVPWIGDYQVPADTDVLVQATSIGEADPSARPPVEISALPPTVIVADLAYDAAETPLIKAAKARGCRTLDGVEVFVRCGAAAFRCWTGSEPDRAVMRDAVEEFLET